jgi:hypothetical protein
MNLDATEIKYNNSPGCEQFSLPYGQRLPDTVRARAADPHSSTRASEYKTVRGRFFCHSALYYTDPFH